MSLDGENVSKLEKADILELTVRHLQRLREKNALFVRHTESLNMEKFWAGFQHCAAEVAQFLNKYDQHISGELIQHISTYAPNVRATPKPTSEPPIHHRLANSFTVPRAIISRELTAYSQRTYHEKIPLGSMNSIDFPNKDYEMGRLLKKEVVEEGNNVWRPW